LIQNNEVIDVLKKRIKGERDNRKLGLYLLGGGMRGAFSGGVMIALEDAGLANAFDNIYSFSSGSFSGAFLLSEETRKGTGIYYNDLSEGRFIQPWKLWRPMNLDYFCDYVVREKKNINQSKIKKSRTLFKVFATEVATGVTTAFSNRGDVDFIQVLKASCSYPGFYNPLVEIEGKEYVDGNAIHYAPLDDVIADGCTDLLVVSTLPDGLLPKTGGFVHFISRILTLKYPVEFRSMYKERSKNYDQELSILSGKSPGPADLNIYVISPSYAISVGEGNSEKLRDYARHGKELGSGLFRK
jgi:predicted patatin/cPLA2 family phospholipase